MLNNSAENVLTGATALRNLIQDYTAVEAKVAGIKGIEHKGDEITHNIYQAIRDTFIHPLSPEDIQELASELDNVLDAIEGIASRLLNFRIEKPIPECLTLIDLIHEACQHIQIIVSQLQKPNHAENLSASHIRINEIENEVDQITQQKIGQLITEEEDWHLAIAWKEILGRIEQAADHCENISYLTLAVEVKNA